MGYYDGNTATAIWNYAQYFAMSDNSFGTTFGPSTPGALNLISGNTFGATLVTLKPNGSAAQRFREYRQWGGYRGGDRGSAARLG